METSHAKMRCEETGSEQKRKHSSIEDKQRAIDLIDAGEPLESVAAKIGAPPSFIQYILGNREAVLKEHESSAALSSKRFRSYEYLVSSICRVKRWLCQIAVRSTCHDSSEDIKVGSVDVKDAEIGM
ncbi:hypothetical protein V9T40_014082 [Parthenolecanium corni]|uniref:Uncharacterized protein n=1 Tax=Parthenolecanium corni TaxID=536013 RepID=A0AAN9TG02_9HEMI